MWLMNKKNAGVSINTSFITRSLDVKLLHKKSVLIYLYRFKNTCSVQCFVYRFSLQVCKCVVCVTPVTHKVLVVSFSAFEVVKKKKKNLVVAKLMSRKNFLCYAGSC